MNRKGVALSIALLATVGVASAVAAAGGHFGKGHGHGGWHEGHFGGHHGGKMDRIGKLKKLDTNNDGTVTLDEFLKPATDRFAELDTSKDGMLEPAELTARMQERADQRARIMMARMDANGDGKVTKEEFENTSHRGWRGKHRGHHGEHGGFHRMKDEMKHQQDSAAEDDDAAKVDADAKVDAAGAQDETKSERRRGNRAERRAKMFDRFDANGDGAITIDDLKARSAERISWVQKRTMHVLDKNSDGKVGLDEYTARAKQRFADVDLDNDGKITASDLPPWAAERWAKKSDQGDK